MFFRKKDHMFDGNVPAHIAFIMDGNGRWAKKRGMPRQAGHKVGAGVFEEVCDYCLKYGIKHVTFYAFSTENWKRSQDEVRAIMNLFRDYLKRAFVEEKNDCQRLIFIGDRSVLDDDIKQQMHELEEATKHRTKLYVYLAINYGGRDEIVNACNNIVEKAKSGELSANVTEETFAKYLYTAGAPDPDIIVRPSGEYRLSNFLLWQCAYSELMYMNVLWPDFKEKHFVEILNEYSNRNRRYGG